jgi:hypothetical protein
MERGDSLPCSQEPAFIYCFKILLRRSAGETEENHNKSKPGFQVPHQDFIRVPFKYKSRRSPLHESDRWPNLAFMRSFEGNDKRNVLRKSSTGLSALPHMSFRTVRV